MKKIAACLVVISSIVFARSMSDKIIVELCGLAENKAVLIAVAGILLSFYFGLKSYHKQEQWKLKREAVFLALSAADGYLSNLKWNGLEATRQEVSVEKIREAHNRLLISCSPETAEAFFSMIAPPPNTNKSPIAFRIEFLEAARDELRLSALEMDKERAWLARL